MVTRTLIGNVPEIRAVKDCMVKLQAMGLVREWELPYEVILTRLTAAIFFMTPADESGLDHIWEQLSAFSGFTFRPNAEKKLSNLDWRVEFNSR